PLVSAGSRYGRRSNWFKIHCLIQDQQEMSNRMAEQAAAAAVSGGSKNGVSPDELTKSMIDPKDFLAKFKENELRHSSPSSAPSNEPNSRISPRLTTTSPQSSSEGSLAGRSLS